MRKRERRIVLGLLIAGLIASGAWGLSRIVKLRPAGSDTLSAEAPREGIGRNPAAVRYLSAPDAGEIGTAYWLDSYTEGDGPAPEWWRPDEEMAVEWVDHFGEGNKMVDEDDVTDISVGDINVPCNAQQSDSVDYIAHPPIGIDPGGVDWNICTTVWGWDGHSMEVWELDLYARIVYLEFWGTSPECCEAGADSILRLWESGYFGDTLGGVLSARAENGALVYTTYGFVWDAEYDPDGLAEIRELCESRFLNGPEWGAEFFQLYGFPEWAAPCYEIDGVYFSTGKGWN